MGAALWTISGIKSDTRKLCNVSLENASLFSLKCGSVPDAAIQLDVLASF